MTLDKIMNEVNAIFIEELDEESIRLLTETTAKDVEGWDSLTHIQLVVSIEKHFKIRFTAGEIQGFKNVGEMCTSILTKVSKT